jgi:hypothetical protein
MTTGVSFIYVPLKPVLFPALVTALCIFCMMSAVHADTPVTGDYIATITGNTTQAGDTNNITGETVVGEILREIPKHALAALQMFLAPKEFVTAWESIDDPFIESVLVLSWCTLYIGIMGWLLRKITLHMTRGLISEEDINALETVEAVHRQGPRLVDVLISFNESPIAVERNWVSANQYGFDITLYPTAFFPEVNPYSYNTPQYMVLATGFLKVLFSGVQPATMDSRPMKVGMIILVSFIAIFCMQPVAWLLGSSAHFTTILGYTILLLAYSSAIGITLALPMTMAIFIIGRKTNPSTGEVEGRGCVYFAITWLLGVALSIFFLRAIILSFLALYDFGFWALVGTVVGGTLLAAIVSPIISIPVVWLMLKLRGLLTQIV